MLALRAALVISVKGLAGAIGSGKGDPEAFRKMVEKELSNGLCGFAGSLEDSQAKSGSALVRLKATRAVLEDVSADLFN